MFGRLLKYDFRSMFKQFAFIWPAALALALVNHFTLDGMITKGNLSVPGTSLVGNTVGGIALLVYFAILMAMFIVALIFVIQRFYKGLLGDEGYLMNTLPVRPWQLIGSKLLVAVVTTFLSVLVALLSILMLFPWELDDFKAVSDILRLLLEHWNEGVDKVVLYFFEGTVLLLMAFTLGYLQLYLAMSIGHLFSKHRIAMSVIAFLFIDIADRVVLSPITHKIFGIGHILNVSIVSSSTGDGGTALTGGLSDGNFHRTLWLLVLSVLIHCVIYFLGTEFILRKKLNLE